MVVYCEYLSRISHILGLRVSTAPPDCDGRERRAVSYRIAQRLKLFEGGFFNV